jgi:RecJ-like exonuclease
LDKWCESCGRKSRIRGAQSCSHCGGKLIRQLFCDRCKSRFSPSTRHRYCPYCSVKTRLKSQ